MPFGLCNAPATFQRCMLAIFHDMIEESVEVFMEDFSVFGNSFDTCLNNLDKMLQCCKDAHLILNWEKCHFMVKEGIMLGHKVSSAELEVDKSKIDVISKLLPHTNIKADHLSRLENDETSDDSEVDDNFPGETLMEINTISKLWFADFTNYLVVAVDYVSKWAEAQALPTNDVRVVVTFLKKLFCRFEMPKALISDRDNPAIWSRKLDDALWAFHTSYKTPTDTTLYKLIYGKNCHLPFKIKHRAYWALKNCNPDVIAAGEKRMFQLHELDELRHQAYENSRLYKERTKVWHDRKLRMRKEFKQGNK
ncbi:reverse transcriptase domain-containing protein, partial [Tanacetum coccineum]